MIAALSPSGRIEEEYLIDIERKTGEEIKVVKNLEELEKFASEVEILLTSRRLNGALLKNLKNLKWIFSISAGVDSLPFEELIEKNIVVTNTSGIHASQIAEQTLGYMINFSRQLLEIYNSQKKNLWSNVKGIDELRGKTLCIIGAGSIGKEIARKAKAFDMKVIGVKRHKEELENFDEISLIEALDDKLKEADYVVLLTPLTKETYHIFGEKQFEIMKESSFFINVSRGDTVDEQAMIKALQEKKIAGAALDVFHQEPLPEDSVLWSLDNVFITPHTAGNSPEVLKRALDLFAENLLLFRQGKTMKNEIDLKAQY